MIKMARKRENGAHRAFNVQSQGGKKQREKKGEKEKERRREGEKERRREGEKERRREGEKERKREKGKTLNNIAVRCYRPKLTTIPVIVRVRNNRATGIKCSFADETLT